MAIELGHGVGIDKDAKALISTSIDIFDQEGNKIGFCMSCNRTDGRAVNRIRHLDSADAGRVVEMQPNPTDVNLEVTGYALYNDGNTRQGLLNRLPGAAAAQFVALDQQSQLFNIVVKETHPLTGAVNATYYYGCMLTRYSKPVAIGTINVVESASVAVAWVDSK